MGDTCSEDMQKVADRFGGEGEQIFLGLGLHFLERVGGPQLRA